MQKTLIQMFLALACLTAALTPPISARAESDDPLVASGTDIVTTTTITSDMGGPSTANTAARPIRLQYESVGPWSATFTRSRVSFDAGTDILMKSGPDSEIRIDIRRSSDIASVREAHKRMFDRATEERRAPKAIPFTSAELAGGFSYIERTPEGRRQVAYVIMRLPSAPEEYTVIVRGVWPTAKHVANRNDLRRILSTLKFN